MVGLLGCSPIMQFMGLQRVGHNLVTEQPHHNLREICIHIYIYMHIYLHTYLYISVCIYVYIHAYTSHIFLGVWSQKRFFICIFTYVFSDIFGILYTELFKYLYVLLY